MIKFLNFLLTHPLTSTDRLSTLIRVAKWQLNTLLNPYPVVYPFTENSKMLVWKGLTGATGNIYCGLHEFEDMGFLLHFLRENDLFIDIGANIGSYTILASAEIKAKTIAIEPILAAFNNLENNVLINRMTERVKALNIGISSKIGKLKFTSSLDTMNHIVTTNSTNIYTVEVDVNTLDNITNEELPILIKIDVEGFETEVLKGGQNTFEKQSLKAIIIELNGMGNQYGYNETWIHENLLSHGFSPYKYNPISKELKKITTTGTHNTIYIRDIKFVLERISTSKPFLINKKLL